MRSCLFLRLKLCWTHYLPCIVHSSGFSLWTFITEYPICWRFQQTKSLYQVKEPSSVSLLSVYYRCWIWQFDMWLWSYCFVLSLMWWIILVDSLRLEQSCIPIIKFLGPDVFSSLSLTQARVRLVIFFSHIGLFFFFLTKTLRDGEIAQLLKTACCSCRDSGFNSHQPHGGLQLSITAVLGDLMPSSGLHGHLAHIWCTYKHIVEYSYTGE